MATLTDAALLTGLSEGLSPGELSATLERVLRVPEAWSALHESEFLETVLREVLPSPITAGRLAALAIGAGPDLRSLRLPPDLEADLGPVWQRAVGEGKAPNSMSAVAMLAVGLLKRESEDLAGLIRSITKRPRVWRSALCAALPSATRRDEWLTALISSDYEVGLALAANALLANFGAPAAAEVIARIAPDHVADVAMALRRWGEPEASRALVARAMAGNTGAQPPSGPTLESSYESASLRLAEGDATSARRILELAWEASLDTSAAIADRLAEAAEEQGDTVVASHALELANQVRPTPSRRARWVHSLTSSNRAGDALSTLPETLTSLEEKIAAGMARLRNSETEAARWVLMDAGLQLVTAGDAHPEPVWTERLSKGLRELGEVELAVQVAETWVKDSPGVPAARLDMAQLLADAREWSRAAEQSRLILAMAPSTVSARRILATSLLATSQAPEALAHWQMLASTDSSSAGSLADCALVAGRLDLAESVLQEMTSVDSNSPELDILGARVLLGQAKHAEAAASLSAAAARSPESDVIRIWLARAQDAAGDPLAAEAGLVAALRAIPSSPAILAALAERHLAQGKWADAADAARRAFDMGTEDPAVLLTHARCLSGLGHEAEAAPVLRKALSRWPGLAEARLSLALSLESQGELVEAAALFAGRPDPESLRERQAMGRIYARAGEGESALRLLIQAQTESPSDPEIAFWLGKTHEAGSEPILALEFYRECLRLGATSDLHNQAILGTARAALASGDVPTAVSTLEEARRTIPESPEVLGLLSKAYLAARLEDQALSAAESWLEAAPGEESLSNLAQIASQAGRWDRAAAACLELTTRRPADPQIWLHLAQAQWKSSDAPSARRAAARAVALGRRDPFMLARAAEIMADANELAAGQRLLRRAAAAAPDNVLISRALGQISDRIGDSATSLEAWSHLAALVPADAAAWKGAASAAWHRDLRAAAIGNWQKALALTPDDSSLKITLARALIQNGEAEPAMQMYSAARAQEPRDADLALEAGQAEMRYAGAASALVPLAQAAQLAPNKPEAHVSLAECLVLLGKPVEAGDALDMAGRAGDTSARGHALRALTHLAAGDHPAALASIAEARARPARTSEDAQWVARAALALGQWSIATQSLEDRLAEKPDALLLLELLHTRIRVAGAHWVFTTAAEAVRHAPDESANSRSTFEGWIARGAELGLTATRLEDLRAAWSVSLGEASPEERERLAVAVGAYQDPELAHALTIGQLRTHTTGPTMYRLDLAPVSDPWAWTDLLIGLSRAEAGDLGGALEAYRLAQRNPALRALTDWLGGRAALAVSEPEAAQRAFNSALSIWPDEPAWQAQLASLYLDQGALETALPHLQQAVELAPDHGDYLLIFARSLRDAGQLSEASAMYDRVVQAMPRLGSVWKEAAELSLFVGDSERAQRWFERACTLSPADASARMGAARAALALGQLREANAHAQTAQRVAPDDPEVLLGWGEVLAAQGKTEKALQALDKAKSEADDPIPVQMARSRLLIKIGRSSEAVAELREAVETNPHDDGAQAALAEACEAAGDLEAALEYAAQAARLAPRVTAHHVLVGRLSRATGQLDRALSELVTAQSLSPTDGRVAVEVGRVHEERRELKRALDAYQRAIEIDPALASAHFRAGLILKDLKAYSQAARMFKRAVELAPTDSEALHQLAAVRALELVHGGIARATVTS
ncbi:MAG: tetratricopeptide repeat protein [Anaerolineales bacterium]